MVIAIGRNMDVHAAVCAFSDLIFEHESEVAVFAAASQPGMMLALAHEAPVPHEPIFARPRHRRLTTPRGRDR